MSSSFYKTKFYSELCDSEEYLYCKVNRSCDVTTFYWEDGRTIFAYEDTAKNNLLEAINRLGCADYEINSDKNNSDPKKVEYMTQEEIQKLK